MYSFRSVSTISLRHALFELLIILKPQVKHVILVLTGIVAQPYWKPFSILDLTAEDVPLLLVCRTLRIGVTQKHSKLMYTIAVVIGF